MVVRSPRWGPTTCTPTGSPPARPTGVYEALEVPDTHLHLYAWHSRHHTAHEAEELMKDNLAASMVVALGVGVLVGYLIRRGTE